LFIHLFRQPADNTVYTNRNGYGPAWANSLFEDNAEFGLGMRLTIDKQNEFAKELLKDLALKSVPNWVEGLLNAINQPKPTE
jgi:pyruvate-ferredoxin/flavodoxin oxidoreductase